MMPKGPGKYGDVCEYVQAATDANLAIIIIVNGKHGHGFSVVSRGEDATHIVPDLLEDMAKDLRETLKREAN